ncbi:MAG: S41 family peptidase [Chloroflexi bacterium]|nr:S41 family peptidase [Chloroflexota bacterium]
MSKKVRAVVIALSLVILLVLSFGGGCALGTRSQPASAEQLKVVEQVWEVIFRDYVDRDKIDARVLAEGAIKGMVEALDDPYTAYLNAGSYQLHVSDFEGKFEGIGAHVAVRDGQLMIIAPIPASPAAEAGILAGDVILEVNGRDTAKMPLAEAILNIRGPRGTTVTLLILHQGQTEPVQIEIVRDEIELTSVSFEMKGDIAYIRIAYFSQRTAEELGEALQRLPGEQATAIILDLRSNPGGTLDTVIEATSYFLREGIVVDVVDNQGEHTASRVVSGSMTVDLPVVVLVDGFSASGSEVLAGALQDYGRATIAGSKTFGKGSVNVLRQFEDGSGLYITVARWLTPKGRLIEGEGLSPDHELAPEQDAVQWAIDYLKGSAP